MESTAEAAGATEEDTEHAFDSNTPWKSSMNRRLPTPRTKRPNTLLSHRREQRTEFATSVSPCIRSCEISVVNRIPTGNYLRHGPAHSHLHPHPGSRGFELEC